MTAIKLRRRQIEQARFVLIDQPATLFGRGPVLAGDFQRCIEPCGLPLDHGESVARLRRDNCRRRTLENAGLFGSDLLDGVAKKIGVIDGDPGDDGGERMIHHIGCVQPAAEADFEQQHIGRMARKQHETNGSGDLEHSYRSAGVGVLALLQRRAKLLVAHQSAGKPVALVEAHQMRR